MALRVFLYACGTGVGIASLNAFYWRPPQIVYMDRFFDSVYWSVRSWLWNYPISSDESIWDKVDDPGNWDKWVATHVATCRKWNFLRPLFAQHGYDLYIPSKDPQQTSEMWSSLGSVKRAKPKGYPYAEVLADEEEPTWYGNPVRVWAVKLLVA
jgi:hypothetical protein